MLIYLTQLLSRLELNPEGVHFFGFGDEEDMNALESLLIDLRNDGAGVTAVFTEVVSNPLLKCPDMNRCVNVNVHIRICVDRWIE